MKTMLLLSAALISLASCRRSGEHNEERLRHFYTWYISYNDSATHAPPQDSIKKYCTASFIKNVLKDTEIDYDPITSTQEYHRKWAKSLLVSKATPDEDATYQVTFPAGDNESTAHHLVVTMNEENGEWKIDLVKNSGT